MASHCSSCISKKLPLVVRDGQVVTAPKTRDRPAHPGAARHERVLRLLQRRRNRELLSRAVVAACGTHIGAAWSDALIRVSTCCESSATSSAKSDATHITLSRFTFPIPSNHSLQSPKQHFSNACNWVDFFSRRSAASEGAAALRDWGVARPAII